MQRANVLLSERISNATLEAIDGAAHFMITTHANEVARCNARASARRTLKNAGAMIHRSRVRSGYRLVAHEETGAPNYSARSSGQSSLEVAPL